MVRETDEEVVVSVAQNKAALFLSPPKSSQQINKLAITPQSYRLDNLFDMINEECVGNLGQPNIHHTV